MNILRILANILAKRAINGSLDVFLIVFLDSSMPYKSYLNALVLKLDHFFKAKRFIFSHSYMPSTVGTLFKRLVYTTRYTQGYLDPSTPCVTL